MEVSMIFWLIGIFIFLFGTVKFIISIIKKKEDFSFWCIVLNVGNLIVQISNLARKFQ